MFKKKIFLRTIIFVSIIIVFFAIDQLTKFFFYDNNNRYYPGKPETIIYDWKILGVRSNYHESTTFLDAINLSFPLWANILISVAVICFLIVIFFHFQNTLCTIGIGISLAGALGNTIDNVFNGGVRNVFFVPIIDRGTFNAADVFIVFGSALILLGILLSFWFEKKEKKEHAR